jgi:hypothetical protein
MKSARNKIEMRLIRGNQRISNSTPPDVNLYKKLVEKGALKEEIKKPAMVISRLDYAVSFEYGDSKINISPRSKLKVADYDKIGELPQGLVVKKMFKTKAPAKRKSQVKESDKKDKE